MAVRLKHFQAGLGEADAQLPLTENPTHGRKNMRQIGCHVTAFPLWFKLKVALTVKQNVPPIGLYGATGALEIEMETETWAAMSIWHFYKFF